MEDKTTDEKIIALATELEALKKEVYRNNFSSSQDFNKFIRCNTRLKIPHYDQIPPVGEIGELIEVGGVLYICSSSNVFTLV